MVPGQDIDKQIYKTINKLTLMKKNIYLIVPAVAILASCSGKIKLTADNFQVTPTPLEYVGGEVPATISANIPAKAFPKKAVVTCIPVLKYAGGQATGASATFQGEKVEANNTVISYTNGSNATMRTSFNYDEAMAASELYMAFNAKKGNKTVKIPEVKIGYGVNATAALIRETSKSGNFSLAPDNFQRIIAQKQAASIKFLIGQANLRGSELNSKNVKDFIATLKNIKNDSQSLVLRNVDVSAYASPDGAYSINERLAERRGEVSENYAKQQLRNQKLTGDVNMKYTAEDWEGFQELVSQSNLQDKDVILRVLSMYQDPEQREQEIRNIATVYGDLATAVLPELRRARMVINYDVIGRSDEEILAQFDADASKLSVEELLYAGDILAANYNDAKKILAKTTDVYPSDYRAYNNLANIALKEGQNELAKQYIAKAKSINPSAGEPNVNLGLIAIQDGQFAEAERLIASAPAVNGADEALGSLYVATGKYAQAASLLGKSSTNSAALAQILANDFAAAKNTLDALKNADAYTYYLKAILAARTNDASSLSSNLAKVLSLDSSLAAKALNDIEFTKYANVVKGLIK